MPAPNFLLPISRLINVGVVLTPGGVQSQSLNQLLLLSTANVIDQYERYRLYGSAAAVAVDFGSTSVEYYASQRWFGTQPQPQSLMIGRWMRGAGAGGLKGRVLGPNNTYSVYTAWTPITNGSFAFTVDGGALTNVTGLNFASCTSMDAVAAVINAVITAGSTCVWNDAYSRFEFTSRTTGTSSSVSALSATGSGTDISGISGCSTAQLNLGGYIYQGVSAEGPGIAYDYFDTQFGQMWYAMVCCTATDANALVFAAHNEVSSNRHIYGYTTNDATVLLTTDTTSCAYQLYQIGYTRTMVQYSSTMNQAICSALGVLLSVDYTGSNTALTLMWKKEVLVLGENLNYTQITALESKNCNVYAIYDDGASVFEKGTMSAAGVFADQITNIDAWASSVATRLANTMISISTKLPQNDPGVHVLVTNTEDVSLGFVNNGVLAPGQWNSAGFGTLNMGDNLPKGFYVYAPPIASQSQAARATRVSPTIQVAGKLAGAIHDVMVSIVVNQ